MIEINTSQTAIDYIERAKSERRAAAMTLNPGARRAHLHLADRYERIAAGFQLLTLVE